MLATLQSLVVFATEGGIPGSDWRAKIAVPLGLLIFIGGVYLLVRANLGTKRGYLVMATSLWGFTVIYTAFWAFGAPGTPAGTGPAHLPGQQPDAYEPVWRPFAGDSVIAEDPTYAVVGSYPDGFSDQAPAGYGGDANVAGDEAVAFFASTQNQLGTVTGVAETWALDPEGVAYAQADNGYVVAALPLMPTYQIASQAEVEEGEAPPLTAGGEADGEVAPEGTNAGDLVAEAEPYVAFAYFDPGSPLFPSLVMLALAIVLFGLHAGLLYRDEVLEHREKQSESEAEERERVPAGTG